VIVPCSAFQVTDVFEDVPWTSAPNCSVPLATDEAVAGDTVTEVTPDGWPEFAAIVTVAVAERLGFAMLVATIVPVPPAAGAVNKPAGVIDPIEAVHVTAVFALPPGIAAVN
jgi:hypothetical protein